MNSVYKERTIVAAAVRVMAVALVLACLAPLGMEARAPALVSESEGAPPANLSVGDWSTIQARLAQAGARVPLLTSEVIKLTADDATAADFFGYSVAVSGDTVVVGAEIADSTGAAYIFARNYDPADPGTPLADNWGQVRKLTASDAAGGDRFGCAVAISGDTIVVGAHEDDDAGDRSGSAYVFERNQGGADNWGEVQKLTASDASSGRWFGGAVSISGDTVVVGSDVGGGGAAYVFERNKGGVENWGEVEKLTANDAAYGDKFGYSVSISGDTIIVGAFGDDDWGDVSGSAYIFARNYDPGPPIASLADNWGQVQKLTASDAGEWDRFGTSVSISGDTVVVGAWGDEDHAVSAYVFERNKGGADNWGEVQKLTTSDAVAGDYFGYSVSISGDTVVVGAYGDDDVAGSVYVFERNRGGMDNWGQVDKLTASDAEADDRFGYSVSISGNTVVVGAYGDDDGGSASGSAYAFARHGATWVQQQKPTASDAAVQDYFGTSVAISGDAFIAGAPYDDALGAAYLFYRNEGGADQWDQVREKSGSGETGAEFGESVAIDVDTAVVGAPLADIAFCTDCGAAYIFERNGGDADLWGYVKTRVGSSDSDFGESVAISGDTVVVGAPHDNVACSNCGAAYVYERNYDPSNPTTPLADNWGLRVVLTATYNATGGDQFGWSVAISGDTVVVGAPFDTHSSKNRAGSVYVFKRNYDLYPWAPKADNWGLVRNLTASDAGENDYFGHAVAISGDTFVVGADGNGDSGAAYVFERNHVGYEDWGQVQKIAADDTTSGEGFGVAVAISGDTIVVGAPYENEGGNKSGAAYLFERNEGGADNWGQVEKLTARDAAADDEFGCSVSISGNTVVVGTPYDDDGGNDSGSAYVFRWTAAQVYLPLVLKDSP